MKDISFPPDEGGSPNYPGQILQLRARISELSEENERLKKGHEYLNAALSSTAEQAEGFGDKIRRAYAETRQLRARVAELEKENERLKCEIGESYGDDAYIAELESQRDQLRAENSALRDAVAVKDRALEPLAQAYVLTTSALELALKDGRVDPDSAQDCLNARKAIALSSSDLSARSLKDSSAAEESGSEVCKQTSHAVEKVLEEAKAVLWIGECRCSLLYTGRGLHEPNALCGELDALKVALDAAEAAEKGGGK